jgi:ABC-2 type transport system permease protein
MTGAGFSLRRLMALLRKEFIQMRRDRITFAMMLGVPLMQLLLFGFAINNDPKGLPTALVTASHDRYSRALVTSLELSGYYRFNHVTDSAAEAETLMAQGKVAFVITIPSDFATRVARGDSPQILVEADATDPAASSGAVGVLETVAAAAVARASGATPSVSPTGPRADVEVVVHRRYNPEGISQYNIVPGLLGVILQMTMVMMTSMALTRETERGTMENLLAMPATGSEVMLAKILPYLAVGGVQVVVVLTAARLLFDVPFVGRLDVLMAAVGVFVLALVLLGYAISSFARTQMQAMQLTFFFFLPSLLISGFMFPYRGMPGWAQILGEIFPLTHFIRAIRAVMLKGADLSTISRELIVLTGFVALYALVALARFRRTLD